MIDAQARGLGSKALTRSLKARRLADALPSRLLSRQVMATPPTITYSTVNALSAGRNWPVVQAVGAGTNTRIGAQWASVARAAALQVVGTSFPNYQYAKFNSVKYTAATTQANQWQLSFYLNGSRCVLWLRELTGVLMAKVDGQYVSLTPQAVANSGSDYYWDFDFGSSASRRIDIIGSWNTPIAAVFTGLTDSVTPAPLRGPRTIIVGDSFVEGSNATSGAVSAWPSRFIDNLGWDNVLVNGRGSSGFCNDASNSVSYVQRIATDIIPYSPDLVIAQCSVNDDSFTAAQVAAAVSTFISTIAASLPNVLVAVVSRPMVKGPSSTDAAKWLTRDAVKAAVEGLGHLFLDLVSLPLPMGYAAHSTTLSATVATSATSMSTVDVPLVGGLYAFADGTHALVKAASGTGPFTCTLDGALSAGQASGATLTLVGDCPWTGNGKVGTTTGWGSCDVLVSSDGTHPTQAGHDMMGDLIALRLADKLRAGTY